MTRIFFFVCFFLAHISGTIGAAASPSKFPCILIFGDSTVDTGNNNYIRTVFKSNHHPYGLEFAGGVATGRFSDGMLVPDMLASELGIKRLVPPFLDPSLADADLCSGVCFASAGSGFDDLTAVMSRVVTVSRQLEMFNEYAARLKGIVGKQEASKIINNAFILISAATNDFLFNFYDIPSRRLKFNMSSYQDFLLQKLQGTIKEIYEVGGRKFAIAGLPPVGCVPLQISSKFKNPSKRTCVDEQNSDAITFNSKLQKLLPATQSLLPDSKLGYVNIYDPVLDMIHNPQKYGFEETLRGCCGTGFVETGPLCNKLSPYCDDRSKFLFWDSAHPTQAACHVITRHIMDDVVPKLL